MREPTGRTKDSRTNPCTTRSPASRTAPSNRTFEGTESFNTHLAMMVDAINTIADGVISNGSPGTTDIEKVAVPGAEHGIKLILSLINPIADETILDGDPLANSIGSDVNIIHHHCVHVADAK